MRIAFLGLGQMGAGIARLLVEHGYQVTVWNRTAKQIEGAATAATPAEAVREAEAMFTMAFGDQALEAILFDQGAIEALPEGAIHVTLSTISVALAQRLEREHAKRRQRYVGCPVFGRPDVAAKGKLWLVAAGAPEALETIRPVLEQFSRGITELGDTPATAHALKLGGNFLITAMIASLSEGAAYAEANGISPETYLEAVNNALFQSPFYAAYSKVMVHPPETPGATMELGRKDMQLFRDAAQAVPTPLADLLQKHLDAAVGEGHGKEDWAAGYYAQTLRRAGLEKAGESREVR